MNFQPLADLVLDLPQISCHEQKLQKRYWTRFSVRRRQAREVGSPGDRDSLRAKRIVKVPQFVNIIEETTRFVSKVCRKQKRSQERKGTQRSHVKRNNSQEILDVPLTQDAE